MRADCTDVPDEAGNTTLMTDSHHPDDGRGCLRLVSAVPHPARSHRGLRLLDGADRPSGRWDDDASTWIEPARLLTIGAAGATVALWSMPSVRQVVRWWWIEPALVMAGPRRRAGASTVSWVGRVPAPGGVGR